VKLPVINYAECSDVSDHDDAGGESKRQSSDEGTDGSVQDDTAGECAKSSSDGTAPVSGDSAGDAAADSQDADEEADSQADNGDQDDADGDDADSDTESEEVNSTDKPELLIGSFVVCYSEFQEAGTVVRGISVGCVLGIEDNEITLRDISTAHRNTSRAETGCLGKGWHDPGVRCKDKQTEIVTRASIICSFKKWKKLTKKSALPDNVRKIVRKYMGEEGRGWGPVPGTPRSVSPA
jgi:hypothetical protein